MVRIPHPHLPHLSLTQVRLLRLFLLLLVFSGLVLYAVFRSHRFQEMMRRKSERILSEAAGRPVKIGGFDLALVPPAFIVREVSVANDPRGLAGNAFSAAEIELRGIPRITSGRIDLPKIRIVSPRVVYEVFPDGTSNFSSLLASLPRTSGGGVDIRLQEAVIQRGTYRFREWRGKLDILVKDSALVAHSGTFSRVTNATFLCRTVQLKLDAGEVLGFALRADAVLSPGRVHLSRLTLRGQEVQVDATGGIEDLKNPVIALAARTSFTGQALRKYFGVKVPLEGAVKARVSVRIPSGKPFRIRGVFEVPQAHLGPFPMAAKGLIRVDPGGLLIHLPGVEYAGGSLEASVRVVRFNHPPVPVRITVRGRNVDFERFFADLDLPGTGLMARADVDTTLTFGPGGIERANGVGSLLLHPDHGRASAVRGRHALPVAGGGPLLVEDGKILFASIPLVTAGGVELGLDGTLTIGTWVPEFRMQIDAVDLAEVERLADNLYPAIQKVPLTPPLKLGGRGHLTGRFGRSFSDPLVTGQLSAAGFVLRDVLFGEAEADFKVDHNVLTLSPFSARSGGGKLVVTGDFGWGGRLGDHYRLDGLALDLDRWPLEKVLKFLSFDLPLEGPLTGKVPLSGITPAITGAGDVVWGPAKVWGQPFDRVAGLLSFEGDRLRLTRVSGTLGQGAARGNGFYRYDGGYEFDLAAEAFPLEGLAAISEAMPGLEAVATGRLAGKGTIDRPGLTASLSLARAAFRGKPVGREGPVAIVGSLSGEALDGSVSIPGGGRLLLRRTVGKTHLELDVSSLGAFAPLFGVPLDAGLGGSLKVEAELEQAADGAVRDVAGKLAAGQVDVFGKRLDVLGGSFRWDGKSVTLSGLGLREEGSASPAAQPNQITLSGSIATASPMALDLGLEGRFDASFLRTYLPKGEVSGPVVTSLRIGGTADVPTFTGRIVLSGIDFQPEGGGAPLEAITGTLVLTPGRVSTTGLTLRFDGGVELSGNVGLNGLVPDGIRVNAHLTRMKGEPFPGFRSAFSGDLVFLGDSSVKTVRGDLTMLNGIYDQDLKLGIATLLGKVTRTATRAPTSTRFDAVALEVRIEIPASSIEIRNNVARLRASGNLVLRGTWGRPLLFGQVDAEEGGRLTLRGLRYEVLSAKVLFVNTAKIDPFLEVEARTDVKDYRVSVALSGTARRIVPRVSSDPPLSDAQIVSLLTTGEVPTTTAGGVPVSGAATPISTEGSIAQATRELLAGLATDAAASRTRELLKLDRLQVDPVFIGSTFDAPRLTVGKNISPDLSVTYSYKASTNQEQVIQVEYQVSRDAFLQFVRDEQGVYSVDLRIRQRLG